MMIEISYWVLFACITIIGILGATRKMSLGIALSGIGLGLAVAWVLAPYLDIVIEPIRQVLWFGGVWGIPAILGIIHLATLIVMVGMAGYNLASSGGKIAWA